MISPDVVAVGAGLADLSCARRLHEHGIAPLVIEAADAIGGRVRTDRVDGFLLDRGFQVLLTAYPTARAGGNLYVCGDHLDTSSIEGAMRSGQRAADAIIADVAPGPAARR